MIINVMDQVYIWIKFIYDIPYSFLLSFSKFLMLLSFSVISTLFGLSSQRLFLLWIILSLNLITKLMMLYIFSELEMLSNFGTRSSQAAVNSAFTVVITSGPLISKESTSSFESTFSEGWYKKSRPSNCY